MLRIRYSPNADVDIEGSADELLALQQAVSTMLKVGDEAVTVPAATDFDPSPYDRALSHLRFGITGENSVLVIEQHLVVSGDPAFLAAFARNLPWDAKQPESGIQYHVHYDKLCYGPDVDESSVGLILSLRKEDV